VGKIMKKVLILGGLGLSMVVFGVLRAGAAAPATTKVGYVDLQKTLNETKAGKAAKAKLEAEKDAKQKEINEKKEALKKKNEDYEKQKVVLKPDVAAQKKQEIEQEFYTLQQHFVELQQDLSKKEAALTREIFGKAAGIIEAIAKRDGYTIILEKSESAVLWGDPANEITAEVDKKMDEAAK
jgi:outer membrane protein